MAFSIEGREPLLDHKLFELSCNINGNLKIYNGSKKYIFKRICHKYIPRELLDRPKQGFTTPLIFWLNGIFKEYIDFYFSEHYIKEQGIFNYAAVKNIKSNLNNNNSSFAMKAWILLIFQQWYNHNF